jgi:hypothetical protein
MLYEIDEDAATELQAAIGGHRRTAALAGLCM